MPQAEESLDRRTRCRRQSLPRRQRHAPLSGVTLVDQTDPKEPPRFRPPEAREPSARAQSGFRIDPRQVRARAHSLPAEPLPSPLRFHSERRAALRAVDGTTLSPDTGCRFLARGDNAPERFARIFRERCVLEVDEDGVRFDAETVEAGRISEDADYGGVRVTFVAYLERAKIPIQIDIGFGDIVTPAPSEIGYPTLLEFPGPRLLAYPKETVVAEKLEAVVKLGIANTHMKDFYDLEILSRTRSRSKEKLSPRRFKTPFKNVELTFRWEVCLSPSRPSFMTT